MNNNEQSFVGSTDTLYRLNAGEQLFVWGFRSMAHHYKFGRPTTEDLRQVYRHFGVGDAICSLDAMLEAFVRTAHTPIEIHAPACPCVSTCERFLLRCVSAAQSADLEIARHQFERWLPPPAADWVMAPTCGPGELFRAAGLILPMRNDAPAPLLDTMATRTWPVESRTLH